MSVIVVCLSNNTLKSENKLVGMLSNLLSSRLDFEEKKKALEEDFDFQMSEELETEANKMCNLAEGIEEEALARGRAEGMAEAKIDAIKALIKRGDSEESILELGYTIDEIESAKAICKK